MSGTSLKQPHILGDIGDCMMTSSGASFLMQEWDKEDVRLRRAVTASAPHSQEAH